MDQKHFQERFVAPFMHDLGAVMHSATVLLGARLGLYEALADGQWVDPDELARRTGTEPRYVAEWLAAQAASDYVIHDPATGLFRLDEEQAFALTDEFGPMYFPGGFQAAAALIKDVDLVAEAFRAGRGVAWGEHHPDLFEGTEKFFRGNYVTNLTTTWIPALDGVAEKLERGARVADVGCGHGASTVLLAATYPVSEFVGFDLHAPSIRAARDAAGNAGVGERCRFEVSDAASYPGRDYDLVALLDCLHDMGDPVTVASHVRDTLSPEGTCLLVEPYAEDRLEDNLNPMGRIFYSVSTMVCTPCSRTQDVGLALGAQAGEIRISDVLKEAGFTRVRRAAATPFNLVFEARP